MTPLANAKMTMAARLVWLFAALVLASMLSNASVHAASSDIHAASPNQARTSLEAYFQALVKTQDFAGGVFVAQDGQIVFERMFGSALSAQGGLLSTQTRFPAASISKLFTATAILQLAEQGKLDLDAPVTRYLGAFPYKTITIRHLLGHTSGLPSYNSYFKPLHEAEPGRVFTNANFVPALAANPLPLLYGPGERSQYDNVNYIVLALVIEAVSGQPYTDYIEGHVLGPIGMNDTFAVPFGKQLDPAGAMGNFALAQIYPASYSESPLLARAVPYAQEYWHTYAFMGFGDYVTTLSDLFRFAEYYARVLGLEMRERIDAPVLLASGKPTPNGASLGWFVREVPYAGTVAYHSGAATGLGCVLLHGKDKDQIVVLYGTRTSNVEDIGFDVLAMLNAESVATPKRSLGKLYVQRLLIDGPGAARLQFDQLRSNSDYLLAEREMDIMGYDLMDPFDVYHLGIPQRMDAALQVFELSTEVFPESWNAFDSYAEALRRAGRRKEAIAMYEKSLALHDNPAGHQALRELRAGN